MIARYLLLFLIFIMNITSLKSQTGWQALNTGTTTYLTSVFFNDSLTGYIGGQNGYLAKTTNGGLNWTTLSSGMATGFVRRIEFLNYNTGYICGDNGVINKTINGGLNWTPLSSGTTSTIGSVAVVDSLFVYACANNGFFLKSTNAGATWNSMSVTSTKQLLALDFKSRDTGYLAGTGGCSFRTTNSGSTWDSLNLGTLNNFWDIFVLDNNNVYYAAYYGTLRKTNNGGKTFTSAYGSNLNFEGIYMANRQVGFACGLSGTILKTINGGSHWGTQTSNTGQGLNEIFFINPIIGFVVGSNGTVLKTTDGGDNFNLAVLSPNGGEIWTAGNVKTIKWSSIFSGSVKIEYSTNNGSQWTSIQNSYPANAFEYSWTIPSTFADQCKIRISSVDNPVISDISDGTFKIISVSYLYANVPDILYYKFNNGSTTTPNYAIPGEGMSYASVTGHTLENGGLADSALVGGGGTGADHFVNTSWAANLPPSGWTIGFWVSNISLGTVPTNPVYLFGDVNANNFRCYYGGSGGIGAVDTAIMLRCTGLTDVRIPVVKGITYYIHIVFDSTANAIKVYKNGTLSLTVPQTSFLVLGNGPFLIGAHTTFASSLSQNMKLDEFRIYGRTLGQSEISQTWNTTLPYLITGISGNNSEVPEEFKLEQNYPNPFNGKSNIKYKISKTSYIKLNIFDNNGKEIETLVDKQQNAGSYEIKFDGSNFASGIYFYSLFIDGVRVDTKKSILLK